MDKTAIELSRTFQAPVAVLFEAIKDGMLLKSTGVNPETFTHDFRVNGQYSLDWVNHGGTCKGRYLQIIPNNKVQFTWNHVHQCKSAPGQETIVTVTLKDHGKTCEMLLVHEGLDPGDCYAEHHRGWTTSLDDFATEIARLAKVS
jgi:uncharacterized protein YndB with AHSA1/START domain